MTTTTYEVSGMTCGHCEVAIANEVGQVAGVEHVDISAVTGTLVVTSAGELDDTAVLDAVAEAGYAGIRV